ncbi:MAG: TonB-dependent receptor [Pyrinomonadaceae bacterium]|nr:TonB-dependent receptor [Sphingobacteriaceae bacterium]
MKKTLLMCLLIFVNLTSRAQQTGTLTGTVSDNLGQPLIGATVKVIGANQATVTNNEGRFSINLAPGTYSLQVTYISFESQTLVGLQIRAGESLVRNIKMATAAGNLNEVVVVGYGTQTKKDVTTSVATLKADQINNFAATGLDKALTGKLAGVQVLQTAGAPGAGISILVRGKGSITSGSDPLYVVDGIPLSDNDANGPGFKVNPLNSINVNDIESIDVLKDASAAAIYGSRGSNGVVLITTKKGKKGKPVVSYNAYYGSQSTTKKIEMLDAYQYSQLIFDAHNNTYFDLLADKNLTGSKNDDNATRLTKLGGPANNTNQAYLLPPEIFPYLNNQPGLTNVNWQDELFTTAPMQSHTVAVSGGAENVKYYVSTNFLDQQGIVLNSGFKKYGGKANIDATFNKFHLGANVNYNYAIYNLQQTEGRFNDASENVVSGALAASPFFSVYNTDGSYNYTQYNWQYTQAQSVNPVALAMLKKDRTAENKFLANVFAEYEIFKGLKNKFSIGASMGNSNRSRFRPTTLPNTLTRVTPSIPVGDYFGTSSTNWVAENTLSYTKAIGLHSIQAIGGFSLQKERSELSNVSGTGYPNDIVQSINGATALTGWGGGINEWSLLSGLSRIQYSYNSRYLFSAAIRADGSSRFGPNRKYGYFPSASAGWIVSEEDFMKNSKAISSLKLRASYGVTGNFQIGNYAYLSTLSPANYAFGGSGSTTLSSGLYQSSAGNPDLGWEKTSAINLGTDISLFKNVLSASVDVYSNNTKDLLLNVPVPLSTGFSTNLINIGKVNNKGIELTLSSDAHIGKVKFTNSINYSANRNKVLDLGGPSSITAVAQGVLFFRTEVGKPVGNYFTLRQTGVFLDQAEIDNTKAKVPGAKPGDLKFEDIDGNGIIDGNDKTITGNYQPKFIYGYSGQIQYSGFDFNFALQGVYGNTIANIGQRHYNSSESYANNTTDILQRYVSPDNPGNGIVPRANRNHRGLTSTISSYHLTPGSYLRIRDITMGYTLPSRITTKAGMSNLRLYLTGQNLFTFTKYNGFNPEISNDASNPLTPGVDYGGYPLAKTILLGLNLKF